MSAQKERRDREGGMVDADRAQNMARNEALKMFRRMHPELWDDLLDVAYHELGLERRPVGRPKGS